MGEKRSNMLDQDKILLMTRLASYEKNEGKRNAAIGQYFRGDYIGWQVLKSVISATIIFIIIAAAYVVYDFESFMIDIYKLDLQKYGKGLLVKYVIFTGIFAVITYAVYAYRYARARKSLHNYARNLNKLSEYYREE